MAAKNDGRVETGTRVEADKRSDDNNVNIGISPDFLLVQSVNSRERSTGKDDMDDTIFGDITGPSVDRLKVLDRPMNEAGSIKPQGLEKQRTWNRLARMDYRPVELLKEGAKSILGKRINHVQQLGSLDSIDEQVGKRVKTGDVSQSIELAGVSEHPCQA